MALLCSLEWSRTQDPPASVSLVLVCSRAPSLKRCNFGKVNVMHPYFQKSGSNSSFWTQGRETPRRWHTDHGLDPCALMIAFSNLTTHPASVSLTTTHFSALNKRCNKSCQGDKHARFYLCKTQSCHQEGVATMLQQPDRGAVQSGPRHPIPSPGRFHGLPNALWLSCLHSHASVLHLRSSPSSTWHRPALREDLSRHLLDLGCHGKSSQESSSHEWRRGVALAAARRRRFLSSGPSFSGISV